MSLEIISQLYAVPQKARAEKYTRFNNEKRVKCEPGVKRTQTEKITTTKWEPEIAKNKANKIGRKRDRDYKYGKWNDGRTDSYCEDMKNEKAREATHTRLRISALERRGIYQRKTLESNLLFPIFNLRNRDGWPTWAWEAYYEMKDLDEEVRCDASTRLLVKPGSIVGFRDAKWQESGLWPSADTNEYILIGNELREDFDAEDDWTPR